MWQLLWNCICVLLNISVSRSLRKNVVVIEISVKVNVYSVIEMSGLWMDELVMVWMKLLKLMVVCYLGSSCFLFLVVKVLLLVLEQMVLVVVLVMVLVFVLQVSVEMYRQFFCLFGVCRLLLLGLLLNGMESFLSFFERVKMVVSGRVVYLFVVMVLLFLNLVLIFCRGCFVVLIRVLFELGLVMSRLQVLNCLMIVIGQVGEFLICFCVEVRSEEMV